MRHDWIFDVLSDLHAYADRNGLPKLAQKIEEVVDLARREVGVESGPDETPAAVPFRSARRSH